MLRNSQEIKVIQDWQWVIWDRLGDCIFTASVTGTIAHEKFEQRPRLERRLIQNVFGKPVHAPDDGELEILNCNDCDGYHIRLRCKICSKEFIAEI